MHKEIFINYKRKGTAEMRTVDMFRDSLLSLQSGGVSISDEDIKNGSPKEGDMIARNPENYFDKWLVSKEYFEANFEDCQLTLEDLQLAGRKNVPPKTLGNTCANGATKNVKDIQFWGDGDTFKLISKASSESEGWMKSTKAMQCGTSVVVQVTTQQRNPDGSYSLAEALTTVSNAVIVEKFEVVDGYNTDKVMSRTIKSLSDLQINQTDLK
jgi:hypothetical protein